MKVLHRAYSQRTGFTREFFCALEDFLQCVAIDDVKPEQALLGFGEGSIDDQLLTTRSQRGGRRGQHETRHGAHLARGGEPVDGLGRVWP